MHSSFSAAKILEYHLLGPDEEGSDYSLVGVANFTKYSESHKGLCHGGSMCALMDDVVGILSLL